MAIIEKNELAVRLVVAEDDVEVTAPAHVRESGGVAAGGRVRQRGAAREVAFAAAEERNTRERPVPALGQKDVEISVIVEIADAGVGSGFGVGFQRDDFEGTIRT